LQSSSSLGAEPLPFPLLLQSSPEVGPEVKLTNPEKLSANIGDTVILKCAFDYALSEQTPYAIHWVKDGQTKPIYLYYNGIPPHIGAGYEGRVSLDDSGREASLNLSRVKESDQGWYECKTFYLMKQSEPNTKNGTLVLLEVNCKFSTLSLSFPSHRLATVRAVRLFNSSPHSRLRGRHNFGDSSNVSILNIVYAHRLPVYLSRSSF